VHGNAEYTRGSRMNETNPSIIKPKRMVTRNVAVVIGIMCIVLGAGLTLSIVAYTSIIRDRDNTISTLNSTVAGLQTQVSELLNQTVQFTLYYEEFGSVSVMSRSYNFSPPISMYDALRIALESGGWNASSLSNMGVRVSLCYMAYRSADNCSTYDVTQPAKDYSPVQVNGTTYRYVWSITVESLAAWGREFPPPGYYYVDAATGEIVPVEML
jgi:hypothetical protein